MLTSDRLRNPALFSKIHTPEEAQALIQNGMNVAWSGFTPAGYPKKTALALADAIRRGKRCSINVWTGASVGPEIEEALAAAGGIRSRAPYYASSNASLRKGINEGSIQYIDVHLSQFAPQVASGFWGDVDVAVVEAAAVTEDGGLVLGPGVGNTPLFVKHAKKVIVEINTSLPLSLEGMHDIYLCGRPFHRRAIPIYSASDRAGSPYVSCGIDRIDAIVESDIPDRVRNLSPPGPDSSRIAEHLIDFLENEQSCGRLPDPLPPIQSGVGSIANAVLAGLSASRFTHLSMFSEILQDAVFPLISQGRMDHASGCAFTPSPQVWQQYQSDPSLYKEAIILRPLDISNSPELIRRLGVIAINTPIEFDIYGQANSTHVLGNHMMNGIGGSGDYMRNGYLTIFATPSTAKGGSISKIVPMVTHADHTEHDTMVFITEQGVADLRGLTPLQRARCIIECCAHPDYRPQLRSYLNRSLSGRGHEPVDLAHCFDMELHFLQTGTMREDLFTGSAS